MTTLAIDGTPLFRDKIDGVGRYTFEIAKRLANEYKIIIIGFSDDKNKKQPIGHKNVSYEYLPIKRRLYGVSHKTKVGVPINKYIKNKIDFVLYFNFVNTPYVKNVPYAVVVHDLAYTKYPDTVSNRNRKYLKRRVPGSIKNAEFVIAVSENTKKDILDAFDINKDKITVAPNGIDPTPYKNVTKRDIDNLKVKYHLPDNYLLFLGSVEPRKNLVNVLKAYKLLGKNFTPLVIAGPQGWNNKEINSILYSLKSDGYNIITPGYIDDNDVPALYKAAKLFLFPSIYEGFGLPILESISASTLVLTSDKEPMSSILPIKDLLLDPCSYTDIKNRIEKIISLESNLQYTNEFEAIIDKYSWSNSVSVLSTKIQSTI